MRQPRPTAVINPPSRSFARGKSWGVRSDSARDRPSDPLQQPRREKYRVTDVLQGTIGDLVPAQVAEAMLLELGLSTHIGDAVLVVELR